MASLVRSLSLLALIAGCSSGSKSDNDTDDGTGTTAPTGSTTDLAAPIADAGPDLVGPIGSPLRFDGSASTGTAFLWDFGDGTTADTVSADHTYTQHNIVTVSGPARRHLLIADINTHYYPDLSIDDYTDQITTDNDANHSYTDHQPLRQQNVTEEIGRAHV